MNIEISAEDVIVWAGSRASLQKVVEAAMTNLGKMRASEVEDDEESDLLTVSHGVAIIRVHGSLTSVDSWYNKHFGITSYNDIRNAIIQAIEDEYVTRIILDIDSPGGDAKGVDDLATFIKYASTLKPIDSYVSGSAFSAAYWIAAATKSISGPKVSEAGSIGVIAILAEYTKQLKDSGVEVKVFRAGKYKALGNPYEKLSAKAVEIIQARMDTMEKFFLDAVSKYRNIPRSKVKSQVGEGLTFFAEDAVNNGLMDEIISFDELFSRLIKTKNSNSAVKKVSTEDIDMGRKLFTAEALAAMASGATEEEAVELMGQAAEEVVPQLAEEEGVARVSEEASSEDSTAQEEEAQASEASAAQGTESKEPVGKPASAQNELVAYLQDQVTSLNAKLAELTSSNAKLQASANNEAALKVVVNEAITRMSVPLGVTSMDLSNMESSILLAQYENVKAAFASKYKVDGVSAVKDEKESASSGEDLTPVERAAQASNQL